MSGMQMNKKWICRIRWRA